MPPLPIPTAGIVQKYLLHSSTPLSFSLFVSVSSWRLSSALSMCQVSRPRSNREGGVLISLSASGVKSQARSNSRVFRVG